MIELVPSSRRAECPAVVCVGGVKNRKARIGRSKPATPMADKGLCRGSSPPGQRGASWVKSGTRCGQAIRLPQGSGSRIFCTNTSFLVRVVGKVPGAGSFLMCRSRDRYHRSPASRKSATLARKWEASHIDGELSVALLKIECQINESQDFVFFSLPSPVEAISGTRASGYTVAALLIAETPARGRAAARDRPCTARTTGSAWGRGPSKNIVKARTFGRRRKKIGAYPAESKLPAVRCYPKTPSECLCAVPHDKVIALYSVRVG